MGTHKSASRLTQERTVLLGQFNWYLCVALAVIGSWLATGNRWLADSSIARTAAGFGVILVLVIVLAKVRQTIRASGGVVGAVATAAIFLMLSARPTWEKFSMYWTGFGTRFALVSVALSLPFAFIFSSRQSGGRPVDSRGRIGFVGQAVSALGWMVSAWLIPSAIQPMHAWLNIGDSTEIVLEETAGWITGNVPGFRQSFAYSSLLGFPLSPMALIDGHGEMKITAIVLWVNFLVVLIPVMITAIIRRLIPQCPLGLAFAVSLSSIVVTGPHLGAAVNFNTSLFRELSYLSRIFIPLLLGWLVVRSADRGPIVKLTVYSLGVGGALSVLNNFEFGFGSAVASLLVVVFVLSDTDNRLKSGVAYAIGFLSTLVFFLVVGTLVSRSDLLDMRLGLYNLLIHGESSSLHSREVGSIPVMGPTALVLGLSIASVAIGFRALRNTALFTLRSSSNAALMFFGLWTLLSAPYIINTNRIGGHGTQLLLIPFVIISVALFQSFVVGQFEEEASLSEPVQRRRGSTLGELLRVSPLALLVATSFLLFLQSPNGLREYRRIQTPVLEQKWVDEWSAERLDFATVKSVVSLARIAGGPEKVGWWYQHGNAIEILTGIENLVGFSGFKAFGDGKMLDVACKPLLRTDKRFIIAVAAPGVTEPGICSGISSMQIGDSEDGFALFSIVRT